MTCTSKHCMEQLLRATVRLPSGDRVIACSHRAGGSVQGRASVHRVHPPACLSGVFRPREPPRTPTDASIALSGCMRGFSASTRPLVVPRRVRAAARATWRRIPCRSHQPGAAQSLLHPTGVILCCHGVPCGSRVPRCRGVNGSIILGQYWALRILKLDRGAKDWCVVCLHKQHHVRELCDSAAAELACVS